MPSFSAQEASVRQSIRPIGRLERYRPTDTAREDYLTSFEGDRSAESMRYVRGYPRDLPILRDLVTGHRYSRPHYQWSKRRGGSAGQRRVSPRAASQEQARYHRRGTLIWEDAADTYAFLATSWWAGGYAKAGSGLTGLNN